MWKVEVTWVIPEPIECHVVADEKNRTIRCPYRTNAALTVKNTNDTEEQPRMFYGRSDEIKKILDALTDGTEKVQQGRTVCIYGQKRCGKSSILGCLLKDGKLYNADGRVYQGSIVIDCDTSKLVNAADAKEFEKNLYEKILRKLGNVLSGLLDKIVSDVDDIIENKKVFNEQKLSPGDKKDIETFIAKNNVLCILNDEDMEDEYKATIISLVYQYCSDVTSGMLYDINPLRLKNQAKLNAITGEADTEVNDFINRLVEDRWEGLAGKRSAIDILPKVLGLLKNNTVIVFMDEFTRYMHILTEKNDFEFINNLGKDLKEDGISFVIAGHERMLLGIDKANANNTLIAKGDHPVPINELDDKSAEKLISNPMTKMFGNGKQDVPFKGVFGEQVIEYVKEITAQNPFYITSLLEKVWADYTKEENHEKYLSRKAIEKIADEMLVPTPERNAAEIEAFFDSLLRENDNAQEEEQKENDRKKNEKLEKKIRILLKTVSEIDGRYKCVYHPEYELVNYAADLQDEYHAESVEQLLVNRGVLLRSGDDTMKVKVGFLAKYLGKKE